MSRTTLDADGFARRSRVHKRMSGRLPLRWQLDGFGGDDIGDPAELLPLADDSAAGTRKRRTPNKQDVRRRFAAWALMAGVTCSGATTGQLVRSHYVSNASVQPMDRLADSVNPLVVVLSLGMLQRAIEVSRRQGAAHRNGVDTYVRSLLRNAQNTSVDTSAQPSSNPTSVTIPDSLQRLPGVQSGHAIVRWANRFFAAPIHMNSDSLPNPRPQTWTKESLLHLTEVHEVRWRLDRPTPFEKFDEALWEGKPVSQTQPPFSIGVPEVGVVGVVLRREDGSYLLATLGPECCTLAESKDGKAWAPVMPADCPVPTSRMVKPPVPTSPAVEPPAELATL